MAVLAPSEEDIRRMIAAKVHIGDVNADHRMLQYAHGVRLIQILQKYLNYWCYSTKQYCIYYSNN